MTFETFDLVRVLEHGKKLLASGGEVSVLDFISTHLNVC